MVYQLMVLSVRSRPYTSLPVSGQKEPACRAMHMSSHVREHGHESFPWSTKISCIDLEIGTGNNLAFDRTLFGWDVFMYFRKINFCKLSFKKKKNLRITWTPAFHPAPLIHIQSTPRCPVSSTPPKHPSACLRRHQLLHRGTDTLLLLSVPALRVTSPSSSILQQELLFLKTNLIELLFCLKFLSGSLQLLGYSSHIPVHTHKTLHKLYCGDTPRSLTQPLAHQSGARQPPCSCRVWEKQHPWIPTKDTWDPGSATAEMKDPIGPCMQDCYRYKLDNLRKTLSHGPMFRNCSIVTVISPLPFFLF